MITNLFEGGMMAKGICKYYINCDFFKRHSFEASRKEKLSLFYQYVEVYCYGKLGRLCYRYEYRETNGESAPDNVTPTGIEYSLK
jgi:hypothetical protein